MTSVRTTGLIGLAATIGFLAALIIFAALDPAYDHGRRAISELGVMGAPNQLAWNVIGFAGVGLLLAAFGRGVGAAVGDRWAGWLLLLFGVAFAATAIPADMSDLKGPWTTAHLAASFAVLIFWALGLIRLLSTGRAIAGVRALAATGLVLAVGSIVLRGSDLLLPGWSQRVTFAVVFAWVLAMSLLLLRRAGRSTS